MQPEDKGDKKFQITIDSISKVIEDTKTIMLDEILFMIDAPEDTEEVQIEDWMLDPYYFDDTEVELTIEPWMLDTDYFNK